MAENVDSILKKEIFWANWKEAKCPLFEKDPSKILPSKKKRDIKNDQKIMNHSLKIKPKEREMNAPENGKGIKQYLSMPKETFDASFTSVNIEKAELPTISTFLQSILSDLDPDQAIEETYKTKHKPLVCWRFLRTVSFIDLVNFHGRPEM